jgi:hypothetical protein
LVLGAARSPVPFPTRPEFDGQGYNLHPLEDFQSDLAAKAELLAPIIGLDPQATLGYLAEFKRAATRFQELCLHK